MELAAPRAHAQVDQQAAGLCAALLELAEQASRTSPREHAFRLCDDLVTLRAAGSGFEEHLTRALRHAGVAPGAVQAPALRVFAVDARAVGGRAPPAWPLPYASVRHLERLHVSEDRRFYLRLDEDTRTWQVFDRVRRRAAIWTEDASRLPDWEQSFPLRTLLNWLLAPSPATLAHAAVVCEGERGVLLAGAGGSGKSTTTVACLELGLETCGDDFVAVTGGDAPRAHALFDTIKLDARSLAHFPRLSAHAAAGGPSPGSKARIHLSELSPMQLRAGCSLTAIVVPRVAPGEATRILPLAKTAALRALVPSTVFLTRGAEIETTAKLGDLVRRLPTHELRIGSAPEEAARCLRALLARGLGVSVATLSLIVPNRNMAAFLSDALASIERQRRHVKEILLVDAGSTDASLAIAADWRARGLPLEVLSAPGANPAQARNAGLARATGDVIGFLDADDLFPAGKLAAQLARLESTPAVDVVSGIITLFDQLDSATLAPAASSRIETQTGVNLGACLIRRRVFDRIGILDETQLYSEDTDFILRILEARIPVTALRQEVLYYRRHPESLMAQTSERKQRDFHRAIARSVRRRAALGLRGNLPRMAELLEPAPDPDRQGA